MLQNKWNAVSFIEHIIPHDLTFQKQKYLLRIYSLRPTTWNVVYSIYVLYVRTFNKFDLITRGRQAHFILMSKFHTFS